MRSFRDFGPKIPHLARAGRGLRGEVADLRSDIQQWSDDFVTAQVVSLTVDADNGSDTNTGSASSPLATIQAAVDKVAYIRAHDVEIHVKASSTPYAAPVIPQGLSTGLVNLWIIFDNYNVVSSGDTGQSGSSTAQLVTSGGLTADALENQVVEILDGSAAGDRRMIVENDTTTIVPAAAFTADVTGASYRIVEPHSNNQIDTVEGQPLVVGAGVPDRPPMGGYDNEPCVRIVNAIFNVTGTNFVPVADGRAAFFGCRFDSAATFIRYVSTGQMLLGRIAWEAVQPPASETTLSSTSWLGWGCACTGGHFSLYDFGEGYLGGFLNARRVTNYSLRMEITGHIRGRVATLVNSNGGNSGAPHTSFGAVAPLVTPRTYRGRITSPDSFPAFDLITGVTGIIGDEAVLSATASNLIRVGEGCVLRFSVDVNYTGATSGHGIVVEQGGTLIVSSSGSFDAENGGTIAGDQVRVGARPVVITDFNAAFGTSGRFASSTRGYWESGLTVTTNQVTLAVAGSVLAVEATTGTSAGVKQMQFSASPAAGFVRVEYDSDGFATLTFNGTDAITETAVMVRPEDDGAVIIAV